MTFISLPILAASNSDIKCTDFMKCIESVSKATEQEYIYDEDIKGHIHLSKNFKISKENAADTLSQILHLNGLTKVQTAPNKWTIINAKDVRYFPSQIYVFGTDKIPTSYDYITAAIKLKNKYIVSDVSRNFRPFMSRYGRIIDVKSTGTVIISDTGANVHRLIKLIEQLDVKPTPEEIKKHQQRKEINDKIKLIKASKRDCKD